LNSGILFVVATPIGNLDDLGPRARQVLSEVHLVAAEDTRHTRRLLSHFGIDTPLFALHDHNEARQSGVLLRRLAGGESVALVSDAGTPLVSDPGYRLVSAAHAAGIRVSPVPGPSAIAAALGVAGLPTDRFCFEGFPPSKADARRAFFANLESERRSMVFFESVHRIRASIADLVEIFGDDRPAFVGRELTKIHEQCISATLGRLAEMLRSGDLPSKGEFVVIVAGSSAPADAAVSLDPSRVFDVLLPLVSGRQAVDAAVQLTGANRNEMYRQMLAKRRPSGGADTD